MENVTKQTDRINKQFKTASKTFHKTLTIAEKISHHERNINLG